MDDFDVDIPEVRSENDFTIFYKGKNELNGKTTEPIEEIKTSKDDFFRKLRYFKRKANEFSQLNEIFIHDIYPIETFKKFIEVLKTNKISLNDSNYSDLYQLSLKYEYHELQREIQNFSQNRPDLKKVVDTYSFDEIDAIKEEKIATHLDICLQNENMANFPLPVLNRILNSPKRIINDHHLLFQFVKKVINKHANANNNDNDNNNNYDNFQALLSSLDYCQMSNEELDEFLSDKRFAELFNARNSKKRMKAFIEENKLNQERLKNLEIQMEAFKNQLLNDFQNYINNLESKAQESEAKINVMETKIANQEEIITRNQTENQDLREIIHNQDLKLRELEEKVQELEIITASYITGTITANVDSNQVIKGTINLVEQNATLDKEKSKFILNTNESQTLGESSYESGSPIQSLSQDFSFSKSSGTYYVHALIVDTKGKKTEIASGPLTTQGIRPMTFGYTGSVQSVTLDPGDYKLEVWGAEGGKNVSNNYVNTPGKGGYSSGVLTLQSRTKLFVHVGQSPTSESGGWNGGGSGKLSNGAAGGGGATDISLYGSDGSSDWNNTNHLYSRIIVAGGGGGSANNSYSQWYGGCGGGTSGQSPGTGSNNEGTQTRAGVNNSTNVSSGQGFGIGGTQTKCCASGGGGGWYGGASSDVNNGCWAGGAGGSGYVYSSSTASSYPSGCKLTSSFYLTNASTIAGDSSFPAPSGTSSENGHSGDGYAKITPQ